MLAITKLFMNVNFKNKKSIIKALLQNNFLRFFEKEPNIIYLLFAFLAKTSEKAVINLSVGKALKYDFETNDFSTNGTLQKLLAVLLSPEIEKRLQFDKTFFFAEDLANLSGVTSALTSPKFTENLDYLLGFIFNSIDVLPTPDVIINASYENQNFSSLVGSLFEFLTKCWLISKRVLGLLQ